MQGESEVLAWITKVTGESVGSVADLKSGIVLCNLVNKIRPNTILKINTYNAAYRKMENIDNFLKVCDKLGVASEDRFKTEDLFYENNLPQVIVTIWAFSQVASEKFGTQGLDQGKLSGLRSVAASSQKEGGKIRQKDSGLTLFEAGAKKSQDQASSAIRTKDRMVRDVPAAQASAELGMIDAGARDRQAMISESKRNATDSIIRSKEKGLASAELGMIDANNSKNQAMISSSKRNATDKIIRTGDGEHVTSADLGLLDQGAADSQKMVSASKRTNDRLVRTGQNDNINL
jgi:hypothetical protein